MSELRQALINANNNVDDLTEAVSSNVNTLARHLLGIRVALRRVLEAALRVDAEGKSEIGNVMLQYGALEEFALMLEQNLISDAYAASHAIHAACEQAAKQPTDEHMLNDPAVREQVFNITGGFCAYCAVELVREGGGANQFCVEHVVPVSKGGPNNIVNYVPACRSCNTSKSDGHVLQFIRRNLPRFQAASNVVQMQPAPMPELVVVAAGEKP